MENFCISLPFPDFRVDGISLGRSRDSVDHNQVAAAQSRQRFPEGSPGKEAVCTQGLSAVDDHGIEIPPEAAVLESVIKHEDDPRVAFGKNTP